MENTALESAPQKAGIKTTEFWLTALFTILANVGPAFQNLEGPWAALANAIVIGAYTISRGHAKKLGVALPALSLIFCLFLFLPSCSPYVDQRVDTTGAVATKPDTDLDGIPDEILVVSTKVRPELNSKAIEAINQAATEALTKNGEVTGSK